MRIRNVSFKKDDLFFVSPRRCVRRGRKWDRHFTGPYRVVQQCRPVIYIVQRSARTKPFRIHLDKLRLCHSDTTESVPRTVASQSEYTRQGARPATTGRWTINARTAEHAAAPKWDRHFTGPYRVVQQCGPVNYIVQRSARAKQFRIHVDKLRLCQSDTNESVPEAVAPEEEHTRHRSGPATPPSRRTPRKGPSGIETPGMTNRLRLRRSDGSVKYLQATVKITRTSWSTLANLLLFRILPEERERILGREKRLQEAARNSRTTSSDRLPLLKCCRQRGTSDHVGPSDDPSVSASSQHWTEE